MAKLKTYSAFVNEALIDAIKNPIKWKKIKNNAKKFQKAKVAAALNDIDYEKKKAASGSKDPDKNAILKAANSKKNDTLKQDTSDIGSRMDDLATTPGLKKVVTLAKSKSSLAANKIIIKAATGEEAKQLKVQQKKLVKKIGAAKTALADYESSDKKEETKPAPTAKETPTTKETPKTKLSAADKKKADMKQELGNKIGDAMVAIRRAKAEGKAEEAEKAKAIEKLNSVKGTEKEGAANKEVAAFADAKKSREEAIKKLKNNIKDLQQQQKDLNESFEFIDEGMYTADQLTNMLLDDIRKGIRKGIQAPDEKELKTLALKRLKMKRVMKRDIEDTINGWENSLADARKDKIREYMFSDVKATKGKIPESFDYVAESVSQKFARLRKTL
mgnify:CR=1 FL=1